MKPLLTLAMLACLAQAGRADDPPPAVAPAAATEAPAVTATEPETFTLHPIGRVENGGGKVAVVIDPKFADGLLQLDRYSHVWVIWWFDRNDDDAKRAVLRVHPRGNRDNPLTGVFACRSPFRPNLVALSLCRIRSVEGNRVELEGLDAFDRTPVIDLKPYVPPIDAPGPGEEVRHAAWRARETDAK